jgi:uncharacterized membrane protein (DUF485 family)
VAVDFEGGVVYGVEAGAHIGARNRRSNFDMSTPAPGQADGEPAAPPSPAKGALEAVTARRQRLALGLTAVMMFVYFGFILLVAFDKALLGALLAPGLSVGIALGAAVIVAAWIVTGIYVAWANRHYDRVVAEVRRATSGSLSRATSGSLSRAGSER